MYTFTSSGNKHTHKYTQYIISPKEEEFTLFLWHTRRQQYTYITMQWTHTHASIKQDMSEWGSLRRQAVFGDLVPSRSHFFCFLLPNWELSQKTHIHVHNCLPGPSQCWRASRGFAPIQRQKMTKAVSVKRAILSVICQLPYTFLWIRQLTHSHAI